MATFNIERNDMLDPLTVSATVVDIDDAFITFLDAEGPAVLVVATRTVLSITRAEGE